MRLARLFDSNLPFVDHLLYQIIEQLFHLLRRHCLQPLHHLAHVVVVKKATVFQCLLDSLLEIFERPVVPLAKGRILGIESALQQKIGERLQQLLRIDAEIFVGVLGIASVFHGKSLSTQRR